MWYKNRVWINYVKNIVAADMSSAIFLASYLRKIGINKEYVPTFEIFDLQKYKVIRDATKMRGSLRDKMNKPFIFITCKN
jgi:hypothetical protein